MKFTAADIAAFLDAYAEDTATFGAQSFTVFMHKIFLSASLGGEEIETKEQTALTANTTLAALSPVVAHASALVIAGKNYRVAGIQEDDPTEGFTRLILTEV